MKTRNIDKLITSDIIPIIIYNEPKSNYKIQKRNNNIKIRMNEFVNNNKKLKQKFHLYLNDFISKLNKNLKDCNFENFCNNVKNVKIQEKYSKTKGFLKYASYFTKSNRIALYNKNFENHLSHELLHMASTKKINNKLILCGFCIIDFKKLKKYGIFLNEGYTEYLNSIYFNTGGTYTTQIGFIKMLEKIIGEKIMQQMYFNSDLKGLINELEKYKNSKEEVLEFIINTDIIHKYRYSLIPLKRLKLKKATLKVNAFLVKSYYVKLLNENKKSNQVLKELTNYMNELVDIHIDFKTNYYYMEEAKNYYDKEIKTKIKRK